MNRWSSDSPCWIRPRQQSINTYLIYTENYCLFQLPSSQTHLCIADETRVRIPNTEPFHYHVCPYTCTKYFLWLKQFSFFSNWYWHLMGNLWNSDFQCSLLGVPAFCLDWIPFSEGCFLDKVQRQRQWQRDRSPLLPADSEPGFCWISKPFHRIWVWIIFDICCRRPIHYTSCRTRLASASA